MNRKTLIRLLLQKQSDLGLHCLFRPFWQATSVLKFRTFTVPMYTPLLRYRAFAASALFAFCARFLYSADFPDVDIIAEVTRKLTF